MFKKTERFYIKRINKMGNHYYGRQKHKRTTYWFLFILPVFITDEVIEGDCED